MAKVSFSIPAFLVIAGLAVTPALAAGGSASGGGGGAASGGSAGSGSGSSATSAPTPASSGSGAAMAGVPGGATPAPGKRAAVEGALRRTGNGPSGAEDRQELRSLNQISHQIAPGVPEPAPEAGK
jgi:hypothetical protein